MNKGNKQKKSGGIDVNGSEIVLVGTIAAAVFFGLVTPYLVEWFKGDKQP